MLPYLIRERFVHITPCGLWEKRYFVYTYKHSARTLTDRIASSHEFNFVGVKVELRIQLLWCLRLYSLSIIM